MPGASWIGPTSNEYPGGELAVLGLVLHIQQGTEAGTEAWQRNPASQVSSHFLLPKAGGVRQMVDTADAAWCEAAGNRRWISVECEGRSGEALTGGQLTGAAAIYAWLVRAYGVRLALCDQPGSVLSVALGGLTYHSAGGVPWGDHPDCPGQPIIGQRPAILAGAAALLGGTVTQPNDTDRRIINTDDFSRAALTGENPVHYQSGVGWPGDPATLTNVLHEKLDKLGTDVAALLARPPAGPSAADVAAELIRQLHP